MPDQEDGRRACRRAGAFAVRGCGGGGGEEPAQSEDQRRAGEGRQEQGQGRADRRGA